MLLLYRWTSGDKVVCRYWTKRNETIWEKVGTPSSVLYEIEKKIFLYGIVTLEGWLRTDDPVGYGIWPQKREGMEPFQPDSGSRKGWKEWAKEVSRRVIGWIGKLEIFLMLDKMSTTRQTSIGIAFFDDVIFLSYLYLKNLVCNYNYILLRQKVRTCNFKLIFIIFLYFKYPTKIWHYHQLHSIPLTIDRRQSRKNT